MFVSPPLQKTHVLLQKQLSIPVKLLGFSSILGAVLQVRSVVTSRGSGNQAGFGVIAPLSSLDEGQATPERPLRLLAANRAVTSQRRCRRRRKSADNPRVKCFMFATCSCYTRLSRPMDRPELASPPDPSGRGTEMLVHHSHNSDKPPTSHSKTLQTRYLFINR